MVGSRVGVCALVECGIGVCVEVGIPDVAVGVTGLITGWQATRNKHANNRIFKRLSESFKQIGLHFPTSIDKAKGSIEMPLTKNPCHFINIPLANGTVAREL